jgi:predicted lipase
MATLCATEIKAGIDTKLNVSLVTFGSPRVGNVDYSALFSTICNITWRVVHYHDIVPHLPPRSTDVLQFWHVAQEIWYDQVWILASTFLKKFAYRLAGEQLCVLCSRSNGRRSERQ